MGAGLVLGMAALVWSVAARPAGAETPLASESWKTAQFDAFARRVAAMEPRNLLIRKGARIWINNQETADALQLIDGDAGAPEGEGRYFYGDDRRPITIACYLGQVRAIYEVGVLSFNCDTRANQDYEVRFADNSAQPGKMPRFAGPANLSTGPKIVGGNGGGFHTRFAAPAQEPLVRADWVQFRLWPTYGLQAGEKSHSPKVQGASVIQELEVLGCDGDKEPLSPADREYRTAMRTTPRQPPFVKQATWLETLVAGREALLDWEGAQDRLALYRGPVELGPWMMLGPLSPKNKQWQELRKTARIDFAARWPGYDGREVAWQPRPELRDGVFHAAALAAGGPPDAVYLLCRNMQVPDDLDKHNPLAASVTAANCRGWLLPERMSLGVQAPPRVFSGHEWRIEAGPRQIVLEFQPSGAAQGLYFSVRPGVTRPGAGATAQRAGQRRLLVERVRQAFPDPADQIPLCWEITGDLWGLPHDRTFDDWLPGQGDAFFQAHYRQLIGQRLGDLATLHAQTAGIKAQVVAGMQDRLAAWEKALHKALQGQVDTPTLRARFYQICAVLEAVDLSARTRSMRLAIDDQEQLFGQRYPQADAKRQQVAALEQRANALWEQLLGDKPEAIAAFAALRSQFDQAQAEILLDTPLLAFGKLLIVKGHTGFASNWSGPNRLGESIQVLSPVRPDGKLTTIHEGTVSDMDLHWDGRRLLFSDGHVLWEMNVDGSGLRRVSAEDSAVSHYDGCYLPNGRIVCVSNSPEQAVPCTGQADVGNLHLMDGDGKNERRVTFDQDHDWNPSVLNDGRVVYTRWEYTDLPHYFSRRLFHMNPDGSSQMEYYASSSYWPNGIYWPRAIPGQATAVVGIVSGHHGVSRSGELVLFDPGRGRHEADGVIQRIPGYGQKVPAIIQDQLVTNVWPKFAAPYPLAEGEKNLGAGKYFLVCVERDAASSWDLCLVDVFDNITPILRGGWMTPIPLRSRPMPPAIPSNLNPNQSDGLIYLADVYRGDGLRGYPRGSIKALRVGTHQYRYPGNGDTMASSFEGGWDVKRILGTVPVNADGSAWFHVPANTPIFLQPLDAEGKSQQQMRSWYTAIPGETASCVGCHEHQNAGPPSRYTLAAQSHPVEIQPWNGAVRGFSFDREVQPVLDRKCAGCHNGQPYHDGDKTYDLSDLRAKSLHPAYNDHYSPAYLALQRYVRRAGYEADIHLLTPGEFEADTSPLVQLLKKGHYRVELSRDDWERLYTWIDYNVPYPANWRESHRPPRDEQVDRRTKYKKLYACLDDHSEDALPLPPVAPFEPPKAAPAKPAAPMTVANWPLATEAAKKLQAAGGTPDLTLDLGSGQAMKFRLIPAGQFAMGDPQGFDDEKPAAAVTIARPFYLGAFEVSNQQYAQFDPAHDSGYVEGRGKDRTTRGSPINAPDQPVVRVSWNEARAYCEWLSQKTGYHCTLPTEAQWEWACRAGTASTFSFGEYKPGMNNLCNVADASIAHWNYGRCEPGYSDGVSWTAPGGRYAPNAWGLCDMHGNVAEWCLSTYRPYPYRADDGRDDPRTPGWKVVRGGSWNDTLRFATSASRWRYQPYHPVYNVGFRVLVEPKEKASLAGN